MYIVLDSADLHYMSIRILALRLALLCQETHSVVWVLSIKIRRENKGFKITLKPKNTYENNTKTKLKNGGLNVSRMFRDVSIKLPSNSGMTRLGT